MIILRIKHIFLIALALAALTVASSVTARGSLPKAQVLEVNDGDTVTIRLDDKSIRTRLIGIDAPELGQEQWGEKAKEHLISIMDRTHWTVCVETDSVVHDKYGRLLVYLWTENRELINEIMILDGYAVRFTIPPNTTYIGRFKKAEQIAQGKYLGIWGHGGLKEPPAKYRKKHPRKERTWFLFSSTLPQPDALC